jgi:hypothetical protein
MYRMRLGSSAHPHKPVPNIIAKTSKDIVPLIFIRIRGLLKRIPETLYGFIEFVQFFTSPPKPDTGAVRSWDEVNHK